ncbi:MULTISPECIES: DUF397 domain-containing protein [unclassified Micromonospora]
MAEVISRARGGPARVVGVRDSEDPAGAVLTFDPQSWRAFVTAAKRR